MQGEDSWLRSTQADASEAAEWISQTDRRRVAVVGQLVSGGGSCTMLFVRDHQGWLLYRLGLDGQTVRFTDDAARQISDGLSAP